MDNLERHLRGSDEFDDLVTSPEIKRLVDCICEPQLTGGTPTELAKIGRYEVTSLVGEGAHACVYRAYDPELRRHVAVKTAKATTVANVKARQIFLHEAQLAASINHRAIVPVYDFGDCPRHGCFLVMASIEGQSLEKVLQSKPLGIRRAIEIITEIADGLGFAHANRLVHRDLKPANILISETNQPLIADFGLAMNSDTAAQEGNDSLVGTPHYMAPEQVRGENHRVDARTDIWALGVTIYEMLSRQKPFHAQTILELFRAIESQQPVPLSRIRADVPHVLCHIVRRCLCKRMSDRYESCEQLLDDLRSVETASNRDDTSNPIPTKGLEAFDENDADTFIRLIGGPRDKNGLPQSIRFWKDRIESSHGASSFSVGILYGPSGSGKSSFVRAGLIPRLADSVSTIFVSATSSQTEKNLVAAIRRQFPRVAENTSLASAISAVRHQLETHPHLRMLVVIDQFEQWLIDNRLDGAELVDGLRQCDGNVAALILVRDEFWSKTNRFMEAIEVPMGKNMAAQDRLSNEHAVHVLAELGHAVGRLPAIAQLNSAQLQFLQIAVNEMTESDEGVMPIRLAIFTQMMAHREWHAKSLKIVGGTDGIGEQYLESLFGRSSTVRNNREQRDSVCRILRELLPPANVSIRQRQITADHIKKMLAGNQHPTNRIFQTLTDSKLLVPVEAGSDDSVAYQLPHDYLVPAIRNWLSRYEGRSYRSKALRLLDERTDLWTSKRERKQLPSFREWAYIAAFTRRKDRTRRQRELLQVATRHRSWQLFLATVVLVVTVFGLHIGNRFRIVNGLVDDFRNALNPQGRIESVQRLLPYSRYWAPEFEEQVADPDIDPHEKLKLLFALAVAYDETKQFDDPVCIQRILDLITAYDAAQWGPAIAALHGDHLMPHLHVAIRNSVASIERDFAAYCKDVPEDSFVLRHPENGEHILEAANLVMAAGILGDPSPLTLHLARQPDPRLATMLTHHFGQLIPDVVSLEDFADLIRGLANDGNTGAIQAVINSATIRFSDDSFKNAISANDSLIAFATTVALLHESHADPGVRSSTRQLVKRMRPSTGSLAIRELSHDAALTGKWKWFSLGPGLDFSVFKHRSENEQPIADLAIGCEEISIRTFREVCTEDLVDFEESNVELPARVTHQQAMHFCYELNRQLHIADNDQCYVYLPNPDDPQQRYLAPQLQYSKLHGIRLPRLTEWEQACCAGTKTHTYIGYNNEELIGEYEWHKYNSPNGSVESGARLPNQLGLFDMWGNQPEWMQDTKTIEQNLLTRPPKSLNIELYVPGNTVFLAGYTTLAEPSYYSTVHRYHPPTSGGQVPNAFRVIFTLKTEKETYHGSSLMQ